MSSRPDRRATLRPPVLVRPPDEADGPELVALNRSSRALHGGWVAPPTTLGAYRTYLERARQPTHAAFLVCRAEDAAIVGVINVSEIVRGLFQSAYLGYYAGARYADRGYMRAGLALVLRQAFGGLRLHRVEANIQPGNAASLALVRGAGFRREGYSPRYLKIGGRWRDHERWALLAEEWRALRKRSGSRAARIGRGL